MKFSDVTIDTNDRRYREVSLVAEIHDNCPYHHLHPGTVARDQQHSTGGGNARKNAPTRITIETAVTGREKLIIKGKVYFKDLFHKRFQSKNGKEAWR